MSYCGRPLEGQTNRAGGNHRGNAVIAISKTPRRKRATVAERLENVRILLDTDRYFQIGSSMEDGDKIKVLLLLIQNVDVFAWSPYEVPGVDPEFIMHKLNVDPLFPPKK